MQHGRTRFSNMFSYYDRLNVLHALKTEKKINKNTTSKTVELGDSKTQRPWSPGHQTVFGWTPKFKL